MIKKQDTDLIEDQAANLKKSYGEHRFHRWDEMVANEKERQRREGKAPKSVARARKRGQ